MPEYCRATKDLDILIKPDAENAKAVYLALARFGAAPAGLTAADFEDRVGFSRWVRRRLRSTFLRKFPALIRCRT
jgi:hypothetical protein